MNDAIVQMLARYEGRLLDDRIRALREILQEVALLGLWRSKFFERAAFYGGTALRILYGLDRFSEDLDFSLLRPDPHFDISKYGAALEREIAAFGFKVRLERKTKTAGTAIQSAFLKADTLQHLLIIQTNAEVARQIPSGQTLKIRLEVDTNPQGEFNTESKFLLQPIPFSVRTYVLPDLFAGKMHALLCRRWKNRVKGRDWYDLVWYVTHHPVLHLAHLERRMAQSGHWPSAQALTPGELQRMASETIEALDVQMARREVEPFVKNPETLAIWSKDFFREVVRRIQFV